MLARRLILVGVVAVLGLPLACRGRPPEAEVPGLIADLQNPGPHAKDAVPALIRSLKDRDGKVRQWSAKALGSIGPAAEKAVPALVQAAKSEGIRPAAEEAIRKIRGLREGQPVPEQ